MTRPHRITEALSFFRIYKLTRNEDGAKAFKTTWI